MRELDAMLARYLNQPQLNLQPDLERALSQLLDSEDDQLWDWLSGRQQCPHLDLRAIIDDIRAAD